MYHHITQEEGSGLTISATKFEQQLQYLSKKGYTSYHLKELLILKKLPAKKNVVITFDDGFESQREIALPLLKKYGFKATFFIPLKYLGTNDSWHTKEIPIMTSETLKTLDLSTVELAHHSYAHKKYDALTIPEVAEDVRLSFETLDKNDMSFGPFMAYPYGKFPKLAASNLQFKNQLRDAGFAYGLRIGNRVNKFPFKDPFEIQRIDVKGEFSLRKFKRKVRFGKFF